MPLPFHQAPDQQSRSAWLPPLARGGLHEFYVAAEADGASLWALLVMLGEACDRPLRLWIRHAAQEREGGAPHPAGLAELGVDPANILLLRARDVACALQAGLEGARCAALGAVMIDLRGEASRYDLTATRRLGLAARASGARVFVARTAAAPTPSACDTRWRVRAAPSRPLAANAPGPPAFEMTLLRARNGQEGARYCVEWDRDARSFSPRSLPDHGANPQPSLSGAVLPVSVDRPGPQGSWRQAG